MKTLNLEIEINETAPIIQVDDDSATLTLVEIYYKKSKLSSPFKKFLSGQDFFQYMNSVKEKSAPLPSLILLDINMPGMDGFEVLEKLKNEDEFKDIPVCTMLTSSAHELDKKRAFETGANDYIIKPNDAKEYLNFFNHLADKGQ